MSEHNIEIRRAEPFDYRALREVHAQPRAVWGTLQMPFPSEEIWRKRLAEAADNLIGLCACIDGRVVGSLGLFVGGQSPRRRHAGEIGMAVHDDWHGRGVGSSLLTAAIELADRWLALSRLELTVFVDNTAAIHLYESKGFEIEGTFRQYAFRDGEFVDAHAMARLH
jgi:putative acetyltransferase